jgi:putative ABC transport system permease protein
MAGSERRRDIALLRLAGASTGQVVRFVAAEAVFVTGLGVALALVAAGVTLGGLSVALFRLTGMPTVPVVPWDGVGGVVAVAAGLTLATSLLSIVPAGRARPA